MSNNTIITKWNKGNFEQILQMFNMNSLNDPKEIYFFLDSYLQLKKFEDVSKNINLFDTTQRINEEYTFIKNILNLRMLLLMGNIPEVEKNLAKLEKSNLNSTNGMNGWLYFNSKLVRAILFFMKTDCNSALKVLDQQEVEFTNIEGQFPDYNLSMFYNLKATVVWKIGEEKRALQEITKSISLNEKYDNKIKLANDLVIRGQIYIDLGEFLKSLMDYEDAKRIYLEHKNSYGVKMVELSIAEMKFIQGKLGDALTIFENSVENIMLNEYQTSEIYLLMGKIYQKRKNYAKALLSYEKALELSEKINFSFYKSFTLVNIIDMLVETNQIEKIENYNNKFDKNSENETIKLMYVMIEALIKQSKKQFKEAKESWIFINTSPGLPIQLKIYTLENALKNCIKIWNDEKEAGLLSEIEDITEKWEKLATDNFLMSSLATIYLLKSKFYLAMFQSENAKKFLQEGIKLSEKCGLEIDLNDIEKDKEKIAKIEKLEHSGIQEQAGLDIKLEDILDYLKNVKMSLILDKN